MIELLFESVHTSVRMDTTPYRGKATPDTPFLIWLSPAAVHRCKPRRPGITRLAFPT